MAKPELKQFGDLTREDFERYPVWVGVHTVDYDEPWATIELKDGSRHPGFIAPSP